MALDPEDPTVRLAVFGKQVEDFLSSEIGEYLIKRAQSEIETVVEKLKKVNPRSIRTIQGLQNQIKVCESIVGWLGEAIQSGSSALQAVEDENG